MCVKARRSVSSHIIAAARAVVIVVLLGCGRAGAPVAEKAAGPVREGLKLWLDASDSATCVVGANGAVEQWRDKSPDGRHAARSVGCPMLVKDALNGKAVVRFDAASSFKVPSIRGGLGTAHVFVVTQRLPAQAGQEKWQRILSCWDGSSPADNKAPGFCIVGDELGRGDPYGPMLSEASFTKVTLGGLSIGSSAFKPMQFFKGDIAEVLVYDRPIADEKTLQAVREYLVVKWGAERNPIDRGWTRVGTLGLKPWRLNDAHPLSDQLNLGGWTRYEPMWDEFGEASLDATKWWPKNPVWQGRPPAFFHPKNVGLRDGRLVLTASRRETGDALKELPPGFAYTSGFVRSKERMLYGYVEMRAKVMDASMTCGFWFYDNAPEAWTEIDIVEMAAGVPGRDRSDTMNVHVFRTPTYKGTIERHLVGTGTWVAPFRFASDFHVYGLEWGRDRITWYVDGVRVRRIKNTHWQYPLYLNINIESQQTFLDNPMEDRYPATYEVDYVRAWTKKDAF